MSLFRKFFHRNPPDGLLEIAEKVFVFDCCFSTDALGEDNYKIYIGRILGQLKEQFPEGLFMVFNLREGERQSQISDILSEYDMTVMDYPRHYEGCPLLSMEMTHHFLRSSESWLSLGQNNMLLMHCERGGWPVLAFMLAGLLIFTKQYGGEQKTLDMIHRQAPRELLQLLSPLNPLPSQLRYLQYISRRNAGPGWPPLDRALTLDCVILRTIPNFDGKGGCRPIFRIYGQDPFVADDRTSKVLFSTPKNGRNVRLFRQADCELVKIDIRCHVQGDVVLECISLDEDMEREEMMFRVMFNTAFIRSNILILNRDEIDILWNTSDCFPKEFRAEVLFSEMDAAASVIDLDVAGIEEKEGLPIEAFAKVHEMFSSADWLSAKGEVALNMLQQITEKLEIASPRAFGTNASLQELGPYTPRGKSMSASENIITKSTLAVTKQITPSLEPSPDSYLMKQNFQSQEVMDSEKKLTTLTLEQSPNPELTKQNVQRQVGLGDLTSPSHAEIISQRIPSTCLSSSASHGDSFPGLPLIVPSGQSAPSTVGVTALLHDDAPSGSTEVMLRLTTSSHSTSVESCLAEPAKTNIVSSPLPSIQPIRTPPAPVPPLVLSNSHSASRQLPPVPPQPHLHPEMSSLVKGGLMRVPPPPPPPPPPCVGRSISSVGPSTVNNFSSNPPEVSPPPSTSAPSPPPPPPPPPICSSPLLAPATKTLLPSLPPPPGIEQKQSLSSPVPPPIPPAAPAPFVQGLSKSRTSDSKAAGLTYGSPIGKKGRVLTRSTSPRNPLSVHSSSKRASLKPLHWVKVTRAMQGSLWAEAQKHDEATKAPEIDLKELENLFSVAVPNSDLRRSGAKSSRRASLGSKPDRVQLIDLRRANNCEIMLAKVKMPIPDLLSSVLALDDSDLDVDLVENLIKFCPTKEEMDLLRGYGGDKENLGKCEQFFLELMKVPRVESKLMVFSFKIQFKSQVSDLLNCLNIVNSAAEEIRRSVKLKSIMQTILSLGNALNQGTSRGSAVGFRLDSLLKLTDTRARNNKMTLMHYLCKILAEKLPDLLDFHKDLVSLEDASKVQLKTLAEEMQAISKGLEKVEQELTEAENDGPLSEAFRKTLKDFLGVAEAEVRSLTFLYTGVGRNADALAIYFGEDPTCCPFEQVASTLLNFVKMFGRAHEENCKQLELERKRAQKQADMEKLKTGIPKKESEHTLQSPVKHNNI